MTAPYVGPGPFGSDQRLFGRDAEIEELQWRLVADRIIVLYSPSGAGKTSLLTAKNGLVSQLSERFHVLPVLRVGGKEGTEPVKAMLGQLQARGFGDVREGDTLLAYFGRIAIPEAHPPKRLLLVLDQFEEVFTNGASPAEQREFFRQLGELLGRETSQIWLLVSMREEYFSWLDPFRELVPTRLANTFRLSLLSTEQAITAVKGPAEEAGVKFPSQGGEDAAMRLVRELSKVRVRSPGGGVETRAGATVEAVQLQVICADLWSRLSAKGHQVGEIRVSDVTDYKPETALQDYCDKALTQAAGKSTRASILRDWIDRRLLTPSGLRSPAMIDPAERDCPTAQQLAALQEAHLVRRQSREDGEWYELAHDSLAGPVRRSIEAWRMKNLEVWQQLARAWHVVGEQQGYFRTLPRHSTRRIPKPGADADAAYSEIESRFLTEYREYVRHKWTVRSFYAAVLVAVASVTFQYSEQLEAEANLVAARNATAVQAGVLSILGGKPSLDLGARAAVAGTELQEQSGEIVALNFRTVLGDYLNKTRQIEKVETLGSGTSKMVVLDQDHRVAADIGYGRHAVEVRPTGDGRDGEAWKMEAQALQREHPNGVRSMALLGDGRLATGDSNGSIRIWDLKTKQPVGVPLVAPGDADNAALMHGAVRAIAASNGMLYAGYEQGVVAAWNVADAQAGPARPLWTDRVPSRVTGLAPFAGGEAVAAADISADEQVTLLRNVAGRKQRIKLAAVPKEGDYRGAFYSIAVSGDERFVAAGNRAGRIHVWDIATRSHVLRIDGHEQAVAQLKYLRDGSLLSASWDGRLKLWTFPPGKAAPVGRTVMELSRQLVSAATTADEQVAFVTTEKGDVLRVALPADRHPFGQLLPRAGPFAQLLEAGDELGLVAAGGDSLTTARLDLASGAARQVARSALPGIVGIARAAAAQTLFVAQGDNVTAFRDGDPAGKPLQGLLLPAAERIMSIHVDDAGSLLIARTQTTRLPRMWLMRMWALAPPGLAVRNCEVDFPVSFPRSTRLVQFRPSSGDFVTVQRDVVQAWKQTQTASGCPRIEEAAYKMPVVRGETQALAFDPDGKSLWVGNFAGLLYSVVLDANAPKAATVNDDAATVASALAVSANGTVAIGDTNGRIYVIQPGSPLPMQVGQDFHDSQIGSLAISRDAKWLVSSSDAGTAIWDLRIETWIKRACALAGDRTFDAAENERYFKRVTVKPAPCAKVH